MATAIRPEYLVAEEAAEIMRVPVATLYAWRHKKTGPPARRVGKRLLYERTELIEWVEAQVAA